MADVHHVCTGECGAVADHPATCAAPNCSQQGKPMAACNCEDGAHTEVKPQVPEEKTGS